jgi:hypothetical protein
VRGHDRVRLEGELGDHTLFADVDRRRFDAARAGRSLLTALAYAEAADVRTTASRLSSP